MARKKASPVHSAVDNAAEAAPTTDDIAPKRNPPKLPEGCRILPLGIGPGCCYYVDQPGRFATLPNEKHSRLNILALLGEDADRVYEYWPRLRDGIVTGWKPETAAEVLLRACASKGMFSPTEKIRGRGCWLTDAGELVVNLGDEVIVNRRTRRPGLIGEHVFVVGEALMKPSPLAEPGGRDGVAQEVLEILKSWNWRRPIDARLLLGWIICAFWGAALSVRPVGWVVGPKATGKSTLQAAIAAIMGRWLLPALDPTPASLWQLVGYSCTALAIDEAEPGSDKDNQRRLNDLVKLARLCFSGGRLPRGGADGQATEYVLRSAVLFSSINRPSLSAADNSRMIVMRLAKLPPNCDPLHLSPQRLKALGAPLLRRAIDGLSRFEDAFQQFRAALRAVGHEGRPIDVFATALAAADVVLNDDEVDSDSAAELAKQLDLAHMPEAEDDLPDDEAWLGHFCKTVIPFDGAGERNSVVEWLRQASRPQFSEDVRRHADRILTHIGVKIIRPKDGRPAEFFAIANRHPALVRMHEGTHWIGIAGAIGGWRDPARNLARAHETKQRFGGNNPEYGTAIPLSAVLTTNDERAEQRGDELALGEDER